MWWMAIEVGHSPDGVLCLFPEWYAKKVSDWPEQAVLTRFPLYDEGDVTERDPQLEGYLEAGDAPIVITPGSANAQAQPEIGLNLNTAGNQLAPDLHEVVLTVTVQSPIKRGSVITTVPHCVETVWPLEVTWTEAL